MDEIFQFYLELEAYNRKKRLPHLNRENGPLITHAFYDRIMIPDVPSTIFYMSYYYFPGPGGIFAIELYLPAGQGGRLEQSIIQNMDKISNQLFPFVHEPGPGGNHTRFRHYSQCVYDIQNPTDRKDAIKWLSAHMAKAYDWFLKNKEQIFRLG